MKYLIFISFLTIFSSCTEQLNEEQESIYWTYHPQHHQDQWDQQAFLILSDYLNIQNNFSTFDTISLKNVVQNLLSTTDTILSHANTSDSLTQVIWVPGLQSFRNELEAFVLEHETNQLRDQLNMCAVSLVHFLGDIGYSKTNIYVFQKFDEANDWFWIGAEKRGKNPFNQLDRKEYSARFSLQEP